MDGEGVCIFKPPLKLAFEFINGDIPVILGTPVKVMPRSQNAHALVNAGFLYKLTSQNTVESARIVFGALSPSSVHASATEQYLMGKKLFTNETLASALNIMEEELVVEENPPDVEYRKNVALALFYKIEGAFMVGVGYWTCERLVYADKGELLTDRTWNYQVPLARDIPQDWRVYFRKNSYSDDVVFGSKCIGEPPICMAVVVAFALREAITTARLDSGIPTTQWFPECKQSIRGLTQSTETSYYRRLKLQISS